MWAVSVMQTLYYSSRMGRVMASDFARHYDALSRLFVHFWTDARALILK